MRDLRKLRTKYEFSLDSRQVALIFIVGFLAIVVFFLLGYIIGQNVSDITLPEGERRDESIREEVAFSDQGVEVLKRGEEAGEFEEGLRSEDSPRSQPGDSIKGKESGIREDVLEAEDKEVETGLPLSPEEEEDVRILEGLAGPHRGAMMEKKEKKKKTSHPKEEKRPLSERTSEKRPAYRETRPSRTLSSGKEEGGVSMVFYTVQVSSFRKRVNAEDMVNRLRKKEYEAYLVRADIPGKGIWYRVRIGEFNTKSQAKRFAGEISKKEGLDTFVARAVR